MAEQPTGRDGQHAPSLPDSFWDQAALSAAFRDRHFGRVLRAYRKAHDPEIKQTDLATWLGITQGQVSRIERAARPVTDLLKLEHWAEALQIPKRLLWFETEPITHSVQQDDPAIRTDTLTPKGQGGKADVHRRDFIKVAAGVSAATATSGLLADTPWQRLIDTIGTRRAVDASTVQLVEDRTADFFHTEETVPARQLISSLNEHRSTLATLIKNTRNENLRNRLIGAIGQTDALTGWLQFDIGRLPEAANAWRSTLKVAKDIGDGALAACALGYWSYLASSRNDIGPAVDLLQRAEQYVSGSSAPATRSWIAARLAEEMARHGDDTGALCAVERALTSFDFARPRHERPWTAFFSASRLGSMMVSTYTTLNHHDTDAAAQSLLTSLSPTENKVRAIVLTDLTTAAVRNGDYDRANAIAGDAVDLTARTETTVAKGRLLALASSLPPSGNDPGHELRDMVMSTLRTRRV